MRDASAIRRVLWAFPFLILACVAAAVTMAVAESSYGPGPTDQRLKQCIQCQAGVALSLGLCSLVGVDLLHLALGFGFGTFLAGLLIMGAVLVGAVLSVPFALGLLLVSGLLGAVAWVQVGGDP